MKDATSLACASKTDVSLCLSPISGPGVARREDFATNPSVAKQYRQAKPTDSMQSDADAGCTACTGFFFTSQMYYWRFLR